MAGPKVPTIPSSVPKYLLTLALEELDLVQGDVKQVITDRIVTLPETTPEELLAKKAATLGWETESKIERTNSLVPLVGQLLNLTGEQMDSAFVFAEQLRQSFTS